MKVATTMLAALLAVGAAGAARADEPGAASAAETRAWSRSRSRDWKPDILRDSSTGALIARAVDLKRDPDAPRLHITTRVDNVAAARRAIAEWAKILRKRLDAAHTLKQ